jgi:predicted nuclease with RNAse H fold
MTSVGIDLAAQPQNTAACVLESSDGDRLRIALLEVHLDDDQLFKLITQAGVARVGLDAPFGWPIEFIDAVQQYREAGRWPDRPGSHEYQARMRLRATDRAVIKDVGITPLSVSSDKIAVVAMRCARLLAAFWADTGAPPDRSGRGTAIEVYPAATIRLWGLSQHDHPQDPGTYKGSSPGACRRRERIIRSILRAGTGWLEMQPEHVEACMASDHVLDALVSALTARAADLGQIREVADHALASVEGWIVLPSRPLRGLGGIAASEEYCDDLVTQKLIPDGGYVEVYLPEQFTLEVQDRVGSPWNIWAGGLRRDSFVRDDDGSYLCTDHGGAPIYFRALSMDDRGVFEHVDGDGFGHVYRYRLRAEPD